MKLKELRRTDGVRTRMFECPGCEMSHQVNVAGLGRPIWGWNDSMDRPTFTPLILVSWDAMSEAGRERSKAFCEQCGRYPNHMENPHDEHHVCHSFVTAGRIQFLGDCTHALKGQTVDLPEINECSTRKQ